MSRAALCLLVPLLVLLLTGQPAAGAGSSPADDLLLTLLRARGRQGRAQRLGQPGQQLLGDGERRLLDALVAEHTEGEQRAYGSVTSKIPFRQWIYESGQFLPTCAPQQVCSTAYPRLQRTNPQCVCPRDSPRCSPLLTADDGHTVPLVTDQSLGALTSVKTCESNDEIRECSGDDWALLAVQNTRSGKSNFLVICRCPADGSLDGPLQHQMPAYAHVPTVRVYGMLCRRTKHQYHHYRYRRGAAPGGDE
ncbi:uncharacterized protein LOC122369078 [Amphibalanus amphitrite]|uniref:uncharacterized protein LOC122369078 n=1 Tax=Amphibalanus amphitrite TaxID=1232801 RepID=UPI001C8FC786|nr:uncharacterized protein LOC122369078 [Amphibalanus amphitrite]